MDSPSFPRSDGCHRSQSLRRWQILRTSADYLRCYRRGRRYHGSLMTVHVHPNDVAEARLGITASRKVGNAVIRHRNKRRIREIFRRSEMRGRLSSIDLVVHLKPTAGRAEFQDIQRELEKLLARAADPNKKSGRRRSSAEISP